MFLSSIFLFIRSMMCSRVILFVRFSSMMLNSKGSVEQPRLRVSRNFFTKSLKTVFATLFFCKPLNSLSVNVPLQSQSKTLKTSTIFSMSTSILKKSNTSLSSSIVKVPEQSSSNLKKIVSASNYSFNSSLLLVQNTFVFFQYLVLSHLRIAICLNLLLTWLFDLDRDDLTFASVPYLEYARDF